jgi:acetylornithine deacetylase/succinyl-diaminopimelate desuccinylase-like protein
VPSQNRPDFVEELGRRLQRVCPDLKVELIRSHSALSTSPEHPCVHALEEAGGKCVGAPWFCDGSLLSAGGIPSVAAGPGSIAQAHTADEWLDVEELRRGVEFYKLFLQRV